MQRKLASCFRIISAVTLPWFVAAPTCCSADWGYDSPANGSKQSAPGDHITGGDWRATAVIDSKSQPSSTPPPKTGPTTANSAQAVKGTKGRPGGNVISTGAARPRVGTAFNQPDVIDVDKALRVKQSKLDSSKQQKLERNEKLAYQWLELYKLVAEQPLTAEQETRFQQKLLLAGEQSGNSGFAAINKFWPAVRQACQTSAEQQANYRSLLRTLLRLEVHDKQACPAEVELISELLGPERVAVPENPPLTEDAVDAYADMTCFIYAQTHPGKSVDALDNRTVFVATMEHRYLNDATPLEKLAMSHFALKWGKFKVLYADASEAEKEKLFKRISGSVKDSLHKDIVNETLDSLMNNGPWVRALNAKPDIPVPKLPPKMVEERAEAKSL